MLRAGIIGLGVGQAHIEGYHAHPGCRVTALCDVDGNRLAEVAALMPGVRTYAAAADLLDDPDVDVVSVASYDNDHHAQIARAIRNGKHVFAEKPLCQFEEEAAQIRELLRAHPSVRLSSNLILRMSPRFRWLREKIRAGALGRLFYVEGDYNYGRLEKIMSGWRGKVKGYSGVYGGGTHVVDLLLWLTGDRVTEVMAYGGSLASEGSGFRNHDMVVAVLRFESGMVGKVSTNLCCIYPHSHLLSVYGTAATFVNGRERGLLYTTRDPAQEPTPVTEAYPGVTKGQLIPSFVESILTGAPPEVTADEVFQGMAVCFAIERAHHTSGPVAVHSL